MKIYDGSKIIPGVIIFLALVGIPFWYNAISQAAQTPQLAVNNGSTQCVESAQWMRDNHMDLLITWRDSSIRDNVKTYVASDGKQYDASLATCLSCHNKAEFCDQCHNYVGARPNCWDCHDQSEGQISASK